MKKEAVLNKAIEYFKGDELAGDVWVDKYSLKTSNGDILESTPDDMHHRLAKELARIEANYSNPISEQEIYELLKDFKYLVPQGSPMFGIGNDNFLTSLSNCFVIGSSKEADSYGSIMKTDEEQVQLMKRRGGVGHDVSHIRPKGALVGNSALSSAGIVPLMERYSNSTREVAQYGRRGALMLSNHIKHPDSEDFIDAKLTEGKVTGANISVKITDEFMKVVQEDGDFIQSFPIDFELSKNVNASKFEYNKLMPINSPDKHYGYIKKVNARTIWDKIIHNAWKSAEPGVLFWDKIISESPADCYGEDWKTVSTNPCGEIPLCPYDSCRLLAINLYSYINNPFTDIASIDIDLLQKHTRIAQRLMDDIIDLEIEKLDKIIAKVESDPEPMSAKEVEINVWTKIRDKAIRGRRTGLGITAEGDMLAAMGLRYGAPTSTDFSENVHKLLAIESYKSSIEMAKERGAFPDWNYGTEKKNPFINRIVDNFNSIGFNSDYIQYGRRNISNLTIAPTGTTSMMTQTTSGIEPAFQVIYKRRKKTEDKEKANFIDEQGDMWEEFNIFHHKFVEWFIKGNELEYTYKQALKLLSILSEEELQSVYEKSPYYKATANDVDYIEKVHMQGRIQKWVDHSISVTVNMPADVTEETVSNVYMEAWKSGCKGVTVYRDGCRSGVLITGKEEKNDNTKFKPVKAFKRPKDVPCDIYFTKVKGEQFIVMVGILDSYPYEVFAFKIPLQNIDNTITKGIVSKRKSGWYDLLSEDKKTIIVENLSTAFETPNEEDRTRLISGWLRSRGNIKYIVDILNKSKGDLTMFSKVIARILKKYVANGEKSSEKCPICGSVLVFEEGCLNCKSCGHSKCG